MAGQPRIIARESDGETVDLALEEAEQADITNRAKRVYLVGGGDIQIGAVEIKDGETDARAKVKTDGTDNAQVVTQNSQPLPTGAATSAKQLANDHDVNVTNMIPAVETGLATSTNQDSLLTELQLKADLTETQPVSVTSLPLPAGASTSANQETLIEATNTITEGQVIKQTVQDNNVESILIQILKEQKKMNLHLSLLTDNTINNSEVN